MNTIYSLGDLPGILTSPGELTGHPVPPDMPRRLLNGRGCGFPGLEFLNIDLFPPLLLVSLYRSVDSGEESLLRTGLAAAFPGAPLLIQDRSSRPATTLYRSEDLPNELTVTEGGLEFLIHPDRGQNAGFFPDMREGRRLLAESLRSMSGTPAVLNLFAYTCAFSVTALAAGASKVVNIDMNRNSLEIGRKNHRLNGGKFPGGWRGQALFLPHDIFKSWGRLKREGPYGIIIADPPPSQKGSFNAGRDYPRLLRRLPEMLTDGGLIFMTGNSADLTWKDLETMARENLPVEGEIRKVEPPEDYRHEDPDRGLKLLVCRLEKGAGKTETAEERE